MSILYRIAVLFTVLGNSLCPPIERKNVVEVRRRVFGFRGKSWNSRKVNMILCFFIIVLFHMLVIQYDGYSTCSCVMRM